MLGVFMSKTAEGFSMDFEGDGWGLPHHRTEKKKKKEEGGWLAV